MDTLSDSMAPRLIMLCGIPTSGKSTFVREGLGGLVHGDDYVLLSTDMFIERDALALGLSYNEVFDYCIGPATSEMETRLKLATRYGKNIVWDQTNLSRKARRRKLRQVPEFYDRIAVWFPISLEEALERNDNRPGKFIPKSVIRRMHVQFEPPDTSEGFDEVVER